MMSSKRARAALVAAVFAVAGAGLATAAELDDSVSVVYDQTRVPTILAQTEHDAIFMQGYLHAQNRFFQMDLQRRAFSGTLAEMFGVGPDGNGDGVGDVLAQDVQLRTLGLRRAAERSLPVQTPEVTAWLEAYADGVNAWLADTTQPLPIEYLFLELDRGGIPPWTPTDSLTTAKGLAFNLSFDLEDIDRTIALLTFRAVLGDVAGLQLFQVDLFPANPFDPTISIPPGATPEGDPQPPPDEEPPEYLSDPSFELLVKDYREDITGIPLLEHAIENDGSSQGSNWWIASGALTDSGFPMIANDPHLALDSPATFYEIHLNVAGGLNVTGTSFPGAPGVVLGCNDTICWGATVNPLDVTDVFNEVLLPLDPTQPTTPTHTLFDGVPEPLQFIPQQFFVNAIGDGFPNTLVDAMVPPESGGVTLIVPRRNNGPIVNVSFDPTSPTPLTGLSVQYTGFSATQELEAFRRFASASTPQDFKDGLQYFDVGSQNWAYADINGNIGYYTSAELPIREDLQTLFFPAGLQPPYLIRDGTHTLPHEWLPLQNPQPNQALSTEILPFAEMPQLENPASGFILNANNDPIGTSLNNISWDQFRVGFNGLLYLSPGYAPGYRIGQLKNQWEAALSDGTVDLTEYIAIQGDNHLLDAEVIAPNLIQAYANATAPGAPAVLADLTLDPRIGDAIGRLEAWDFSTPTGIDVGFDPGDNPLAPGPPTPEEVDASIAATIYSVWRGQIVQRVIDGTLAAIAPPLAAQAPPSDRAMIALRQLLDDYPVKGGTGASLINFFTVPGVADQFVARDIILLEELRNALDLLASDEFAPAFANSTDLDDYRWGLLHRIVFDNALSPQLSIPPVGSPQNVSPDLPGFARAGGMGALDASAHSARADGLNEFMFGSGPSRRFIATMTPDGPDALEVIPGGESGNAGSPFQADQLGLWLVNLYKPLPVSLEDVNATGVETQTFVCGDGAAGPGEQCDDGNTNDADGCDTSCEASPVITCGNPAVSADAESCTATVACSAIASCVDASGAASAVTCDGDSFGPGTTDVTVQCAGVATTCPVTVVDDTPPTISVSLDPDSLWPPNHRMVDVIATVSVDDACGSATFTLDSVDSDEPDDASGGGDGNTVDDIQDADLGTSDTTFQLRAERAGGGDGRTYTVTYSATDAAGNVASASATADVAHDQGGMTEPLEIRLSQNVNGTVVNWNPVPGAWHYNVIRVPLSEVEDVGNWYSLNIVTCIEAGSNNETTQGHEDAEIPAPGEVFLYFAEYVDAEGRTEYGTETAWKPREVKEGDCE